MRMSGLLGAALALSVLTPIAPAHATVSIGDLMYTDLFLWPDWREIVAKYECTPGLTFYLLNAPPSAPPSATGTLPQGLDPSDLAASSESSEGAVDPLGTPGGDPPRDPPPGPLDPIGTPGMPGGDPPVAATAVPEPATWAMLLLGFAGLGCAGVQRSNKSHPASPRLRRQSIAENRKSG